MSSSVYRLRKTSEKIPRLRKTSEKIPRLRKTPPGNFKRNICQMAAGGLTATYHDHRPCTPTSEDCREGTPTTKHPPEKFKRNI